MSENEVVDWNDSKKLNVQANEAIKTANQYRIARQNCAEAKIALDMLLVKAYQDRKIEKKPAYEKAMLLVIGLYVGTDSEEEVARYYKNYVREEANYKSLEKLLDAQQSKISLCQSLIKNQIRNS